MTVQKGDPGSPVCASPHRRPRARRPATMLGISIGMALASALCIAPASADEVAYLVNVTVRPGYGFTSADDALIYGHRLCDQVVQGVPYRMVEANVKADLGNPDEYQASYLISQAVEELCPAQIWQLRKSAAEKRPQE